MSEPAMPKAVERLLTAVGREKPFLDAHHGAAASRLMAMIERARLVQRVTMSYNPTRIGRAPNASGQADIADSAAEARQRLARLARALPADCWSVLFDVCGLEMGLLEVEAARGWPRRSAKLVLRVALDHLATVYGLDPGAVGAEKARQRGWLEARPDMFGTET